MHVVVVACSGLIKSIQILFTWTIESLYHLVVFEDLVEH